MPEVVPAGVMITVEECVPWSAGKRDSTGAKRFAWAIVAISAAFASTMDRHVLFALLDSPVRAARSSC
jgi:hypothetical protein